MKTPEEIKKGLAACSADECHGQHEGCTYQDQLFCTMRMCGDALAYIQKLEDAIDKTTQLMRSSTEVIKKNQEQLETTYSQVKKALCGKENVSWVEVLEAAEQLKSRLAQAERERDAAVRAISDAKHYIKDLGAISYGLQQLENWDYSIKKSGICPENTEGENADDERHHNA